MAAASSSLIGSSGQVIGRLVALGVLPIIAALIALSWFAAAPLARRLQFDRGHVAICLAVTAPILAVTLLRDGWPRGLADNLGLTFTWWLHGWGDVANDLANGSEAVLNVVLFVPAGLAWAATTSRHGRTLVALVATSFVIETMQALLALGAPDTTDLVANSLGAAVGVGAAVVAGAVWRRTKWSTLEPTVQGRSRLVKVGAAAAVLVAVVAAMLFVQWRADAARDDLLAELHDTYDGSTLGEMQAVFEDSAGGYQEFLDRNSVRPDSQRSGTGPHRTEVRYPTMYFGLSRCVFVTWTDEGVSFRVDDGDHCTDYLGETLD